MRVAAIGGRNEFGLRHRAAVNRTGIEFHPVGVNLQSRLRAGIKIAARSRSNIHQEIAAERNGVNQHPQQHFRILPRLLVAIIAPAAGERLALLALTKTYGIEGVNGESPYYKSIEIKNDTIVVSFERANMWISGKNCFESKNFQVAGEDKVFYPAKAWIERSKMLVKSDKVPHPVAVRYGFENYVEGDVYCDGLPLGSFRSDDW